MPRRVTMRVRAMANGRPDRRERAQVRRDRNDETKGVQQPRTVTGRRQHARSADRRRDGASTSRVSQWTAIRTTRQVRQSSARSHTPTRDLAGSGSTNRQQVQCSPPPRVTMARRAMQGGSRTNQDAPKAQRISKSPTVGALSTRVLRYRGLQYCDACGVDLAPTDRLSGLCAACRRATLSARAGKTKKSRPR